MRQLELNLTPRHEHHGTIQPWRYRFSDHGLIEERGRGRYVYGLWDKLFGCWAIDLEGHASREIIPTWKPLNQNGIWRDHLKIRFESPLNHSRTFSPKWRYEANAAFAGYFSEIPQRIRAVAAPMEHYQWLSLDMIWQVSEFAHFLDEEFFNGTQQYVFACLALGKAEEMSRKARGRFAEMIMNTKRAKLLSDLSDVPCSKKILPVLNRLGDRPRSAELYIKLFEFMNHPQVSKTLLHADTVNSGAIKLLTLFPAELLTPNLAQILLNETDACELLAEIDDYDGNLSFRTLINLFPVVSPQWQERIRSSLEQVRNSTSLEAWGEKWAHRLTETIRFPPPPFRATNYLIPLATAKAVRQVSLEMGNCISKMMNDVLAEHIYFYAWEGPEIATVMLENTPDAGWQLSEALGYDNNPLSAETYRSIEHVVETALATQRPVLFDNAEIPTPR